MRVLVTGGCGFIGSHFVKRLLAGGDQVVVLDKLTYAGNPANLDGVSCELIRGDIADPAAVEAAAEGCDAIVNFAAETHVDRSIHGAAEFIQTDVLGTYVLLERARAAGLRLVHVSTDEVYGDAEPDTRSLETDRSEALEPVRSLEGRRRPAGPRVRAHARRRRGRHPRLEHLRPVSVPREADPALRDERARR